MDVVLTILNMIGMLLLGWAYVVGLLCIPLIAMLVYWGLKKFFSMK